MTCETSMTVYRGHCEGSHCTEVLLRNGGNQHSNMSHLMLGAIFRAEKSFEKNIKAIDLCQNYVRWDKNMMGLIGGKQTDFPANSIIR